ncbi:MAG TPA: adenine deaminase [Verrucomicrobiae bacterium]|nr:adenine deaminase [Verrucomicrobiae bacterium]
MKLTRLIKIARGEEPPDLVIKGGQIVNVLSSEVYPADIAICGETIAGIGDYSGPNELDARGKFITPGFIDGHMHIESSMVTVWEFAKTVMPHGTTTIMADPHELANVLGVEGIEYVLKTAKYQPLSVYVMLPSCVPATDLETSGARLKAVDLLPYLDSPWVLGLAEMMNYPGVIHRTEEVLEKLRVVGGKVVDGHAPQLSGKDLNAYVAAGIGNDHECTTVAEAREKMRLGMSIAVREGSVTRDLLALLPLIKPENADRFFFCTDDRTPADLMDRGHIDSMVRMAIKAGLDPALAVRLATINAARYFGLPKVGAIAPGWFADLNILTDLKACVVEKVFKRGHLVAEKGYLLGNKPMSSMIDVRNTVKIRPLGDSSFNIAAKSGRARVMELIPNQIITRQIFAEPKRENGHVVSDTERDILKIAVIERHHGTGNIGLGLTKGFGLKSGAIASSVGHDAHNINVVGTNDADMRAAVEHIVKMQGGFAVANHGEILGSVALPIAGLLSNKPLSDVKDELDAANHATKKLGCAVPEPFMALSFMALSVIPELKLTDRGLVDVNQFKFVDLFEN